MVDASVTAEDPALTIKEESLAKSGDAPPDLAAEAADAGEGALESVVLQDLLILPPLNNQGGTTTTTSSITVSEQELLDAVPLPPIRTEEPVQSLRTALSEVCGYAHLTNYRLELVAKSLGLERKALVQKQQQGEGTKDSQSKKQQQQNAKGGKKKPVNGSSSDASTTTLIEPSPYTGKGAVVSVPALMPKEGLMTSTPVDKSKNNGNDPIVLDDFGDLSPLMGDGLADGSAFRIVLERYDVAAVRDHVARLRSLLDGNAPTVTSFVDDSAPSKNEATPEAAAPEEKKTSEQEEGTKEDPNPAADAETPKDAAMTDEEKKAADEAAQQKLKAEAMKKQEEISKKTAAQLPQYALNKSVAADGKNLHDFFYLACGEDPDLYHGMDRYDTNPMNGANNSNNGASNSKNGKSKKKKKNKKNSQQNGFKSDGTSDSDADEGHKNKHAFEESIRKTIPRLNSLEETTRVPCTIRFSGYHPPPAHRKLMGDLAYLEVIVGQSVTPIFITAISTGFYVNKSTPTVFDPAPAVADDSNPTSGPCFSHELLDCLLRASSSLALLWSKAVEASKERADFMNTNNKDGPFSSLFRVAVRGDFDGYTNPATATATTGIDALLQTPSWMTPLPEQRSMKNSTKGDKDWKHYQMHKYNLSRTEDELCSTFGVDVRSGAVRDWNEELQSAREMPTTTLHERIERARIIHKVLTDFGEASVIGVKAIMDGHISAMNPNEVARSQVFLHNNIFFSRAVDAGVETFKIAKGDKAARKSASRDIQCIGTLHRMDTSELHTLATVLIDYLGTRFVCQSILPGILSGDKTHTLLYGAVEAGCKLKWDNEMHEALENTVGKTLQVATRNVPRQPLTDERLEEIKAIKSTIPAYINAPQLTQNDDDDKDASPLIETCAPLEAKGIRGSDQRKYLLDISRLTPRDANWVPKEQGGTGLWEGVQEKAGKSQSSVPKSLDDDEWTLAVLRPELVTRYVKSGKEQYLRSLKEKGGDKSKEEDTSKEKKEGPESKKEVETTDVSKPEEDSKKMEEKKEEPRKLTDAEIEHLKTFRVNINVFLPDVRQLDADSDAMKQLKADEETARDAARMLWDQLLPRITADVRDANGPYQQLPPDGRSVTELLHQQGINCRYLGRLAMLAQEEEAKDKMLDEEMQKGNVLRISRRKMPLYWLEILECEMVARASKHVLETYLTENGGSSAAQPSQTIASFLSALISESEETAAQTETRIGRNNSGPDEDDFNALTLCDTGGGGDAVPGTIRTRTEVWKDIEKEVGRRFRYSLTLYNPAGKASRALYIPLLRRICQRTGTRLAAKNYDVGGKCLCSGGSTSGGRLTSSYPVEPTDIVDVVPMMKHAAAHVEGFVPCSIGTTIGLPSLHISLPDARTTLEAAHLHCNARSLAPALDLAQEAASLYQRVTDTPAHPGVVRCMDLMATVLFEAGEPALAANSALKSLGLLVQVGGFDSFDTVSAHLLLFQMFVASQQVDKGIKHLKAALYLMEIMAGPHYPEHSNVYHKMGTLFHSANNMVTALRFYQEAGLRDVCDRLHEGMIKRSTSMVLASLGQLKLAVQNEKRAFQLFSLMFGEEHNLTKASDTTLKNFMRAAVQQGNRMVEDEKKRKEENAAAAMASQIEAEESEEKKKKKNSKKKKGKK